MFQICSGQQRVDCALLQPRGRRLRGGSCTAPCSTSTSLQTPVMARPPSCTLYSLGSPAWLQWLRVIIFILPLLAFAGCGSTKSYTATEQLLMSDAVDATVAKLDFSPLSGKQVFLDSTYLKTVKSPLLIDSDYVISSLRQQMVGAGVYLVEAREDADLIAEARLGALGLDGHTVTYGVPASSSLAGASAAIANTPILPILPEISFARREAKTGAAKLAVFAYERDSHEPYWQSGIAKASSNARDTWVLGVGPWQKGTIYDRTRFAGGIVAGTDLLDAADKDVRSSAAFAAYRKSRLYESAKDADVPTEENASSSPASGVVPASNQEQGAPQ